MNVSRIAGAIVAAAAVSVLAAPAGQAQLVPQGRLEDQLVPLTGASEIQALRVRPNVFMLVGAGANITVQIPPPSQAGHYYNPYLPIRQGVLLVDTGSAAMNATLLSVVRQLSTGRIQFVVNTHGDPDHTGGNAGLVKAAAALGVGGTGGGGGGDAPPGGLVIFAHENVINRLSDDREPEAIPSGGFYTDKQLVFNGESIDITHVSGAHTDGDSIVFFRRSDVISAGDIFSTESFPRFDPENGGSIKGIIDGLNRILEIAIPGDRIEDGTLVIPGHGRLSDYSDVNEYRNAVVIVRDRVGALIERGMTLEQVQAARPALDYESRYSTPSWTPAMFIEAVYRSLSDK